MKKFALECGADIVGIGSIDRFEGAPKECDPRYIFPEAKSIIGLGFRIHRGLLRGIEEGTYFAGYPAMGYANINDVFAPIVLRLVGNFIENHGYEAVLYQIQVSALDAMLGSQSRKECQSQMCFFIFALLRSYVGWAK